MRPDYSGLLDPVSGSAIPARSSGTGFSGWNAAAAADLGRENSPVAYTPTTDARVARLRRAAVINLFELLGLGIVPPQCWPVLDAVGNPVLAVSLFLDKLGVDAEALRDGDPLERDRADDVLDLLIDIADAFDTLNPDARADVEAALYSGDYDRVRGAAELVRIYQRVADMAARWPSSARFPAVDRFLAQIAAELANPMQATLDEAQEAEGALTAMVGLLDRLAGVRDRRGALRDWLNAASSDWTSGALADAIIRNAADFEARDASISSADLDVPDVATLVGEQVLANDALEALAQKAVGGRAGRTKGSKGSAPPPPPPQTKLARALDYFGISDLVDLATWKAIKRDFQMKTHPDRGGSHESFIEFTRHKTAIDEEITARTPA